jgi:hypothetical protein
MKYIGIGILGFISTLGLVWLIQGNDFFLYKFWAPKYENVRREVFENTKSYNQGYIQELENMQYEYIQANSEQRKSLASIILHRVADYDMNRLTPELRNFIEKLRVERNSL